MVELLQSHASQGRQQGAKSGPGLGWCGKIFVKAMVGRVLREHGPLDCGVDPAGPSGGSRVAIATKRHTDPNPAMEPLLRMRQI